MHIQKTRKKIEKKKQKANNKKVTPPRPVTLKLQKIKGKEKILKEKISCLYI